MKNNSLYLPGFHLSTLRRKPRSTAHKLADSLAHIRRHSISSLGECFARFIPSKVLENGDAGSFSRRRVFSKTNTFWAFFSQVLDADGGCQEVVRKMQALAASRSLPSPSASTSAYCQARAKLEVSELETILSCTAKRLHDQGRTERWKDRRVVVVDGTGLSMPDTSENQAVWPQTRGQKPGCSFPQATVCACFCLHTGALLSHRVGSRKNNELPLLREQHDQFKPGDIFLGDKGFCSYYDVDKFQKLGVDSVISLGVRKPVAAASALEVLAHNDLLIQWPRPKTNRTLSYGKEEWQALPEQLTLRQIKVVVDNPGFRVQSFYIVTTLTDAKTYSAADIADLYYQRWDVELFFRDIKTTMGMDILRCRTPAMVRKEILMHLIVYNSIRLLMLNAAKQAKVSQRRISFKASVQALRQWEPILNRNDMEARERKRLMVQLREAIAATIVLSRPGRSEPRCRKRRPKNFQSMTSPRHEMWVTPHRGQYRAKRA
jgi:hypothetical protein